MKAVAILSQLIGVAMLVVGAKRHDYLLMVGGMLWAAGNMYYYAMLYLLPVLVIELFGRGDRVEGEERKWWIWIELASLLQGARERKKKKKTLILPYITIYLKY